MLIPLWVFCTVWFFTVAYFVWSMRILRVTIDVHVFLWEFEGGHGFHMGFTWVSHGFHMGFTSACPTSRTTDRAEPIPHNEQTTRMGTPRCGLHWAARGWRESICPGSMRPPRLTTYCSVSTVRAPLRTSTLRRFVSSSNRWAARHRGTVARTVAGACGVFGVDDRRRHGGAAGRHRYRS